MYAARGWFSTWKSRFEWLWKKGTHKQLLVWHSACCSDSCDRPSIQLWHVKSCVNFSRTMAEGQSVSSFPPPPLQYVNLFTDENVKRGRIPKPPPPIKVCALTGLLVPFSWNLRKHVQKTENTKWEKRRHETTVARVFLCLHVQPLPPPFKLTLFWVEFDMYWTRAADCRGDCSVLQAECGE